MLRSNPPSQGTDLANARPGRPRLALLVMMLTPVVFSTNLIFGRGVIDQVSPFTLACLRWLAVAAALSPFTLMDRLALCEVVRSSGKHLLALSFLGMWVCGGIVYFALQNTTATNATLIMTSSPVIILLLEAVWAGRRIGLREALGAILAFLGIAAIVLRGELSALLDLSFNWGDLLLLSGATAWAVYSLIFRSPALKGASNAALLGLLAAIGALMLAPVAFYEWASGGRMPVTREAWTGIAGIVIFSSLLAFSGYQYGVRQLGPSLASVFMYLMPAYGVLLAVVFLGERLEPFHYAGIALVMGGVVLATLPAGWFKRELRP